MQVIRPFTENALEKEAKVLHLILFLFPALIDGPITFSSLENYDALSAVFEDLLEAVGGNPANAVELVITDNEEVEIRLTADARNFLEGYDADSNIFELTETGIRINRNVSI